MNLPNVLTLSRFILAAVMVFVLMERSLAGDVLAVIVFAAASLTDFYDGHLAKTRGLTSDFGKIMDPIADKALLLSVFGVLAYTGEIRWWMFLVIAVREIGVTISRLMACCQGRVLPAERAGKIKTVSQMIAVASILIYLVAWAAGCGWFYHVQGIWSDVNYGLMLAVVVLTVYSGIDYFRHKKI